MTQDKDKVYVEHILEAISRIENFLDGKTHEQFLNEIILQDGIIRELEVIGEASKHLSEELKNSAPNIPWKDITGMRDKLIHDYFSVNLAAVWNTAKENLKPLKSALKSLIK